MANSSVATSPPLLTQTTTLQRVAHVVLIGVALALPWSTSAASIFIGIYIALSALGAATRQIRFATAPARHWAGLSPLLLIGLAAAGLVWGDVPVSDQWRAFQSFAKLAVIPVLFAHVQTERAIKEILAAFVLSSAGLVLLSLASKFFPELPWWWWFKAQHVPVKDNIHLSTCYLTSACGVAYFAFARLRIRDYVPALLLGALALLFVFNMSFVSVSRTALFVFPCLALIMGYQLGGVRGLASWGVLFVAVGGIATASSDLLRERIAKVVAEARYERADEFSENLRFAIWRRSLDSIAEAPILGHGTGAIRSQFAKTEHAYSDPRTVLYSNAHNQTLTIAMQLGLAGIIVLFMLWYFHAALFVRGSDWVSHLGILLVVQNILSSLANSHLSDFTSGWIYVFGVGLLGGQLFNRTSGADNGRA